MKTRRFILSITILTVITLSGYAQKGTGSKFGNAMNINAGQTKTVSGELTKVINEPCTGTTGRYSNGTHLFIQSNGDNEEKLNIHTGPTKLVSKITDNLEEGKEIGIEIFTTANLPANQYIAKKIEFEGETYELRDSNLKPFWAISKDK